MLQSLIDKYGFFIAILVQIGMVTVSMIGLAPNTYTMVGYIGLGVAAVLFAPRSFQKYLETKEKRYFINWALFAVFTVFIGISFALAGTVQQNEVSMVEINIETDAALSAYESDLSRAYELSEQLKDEYDQTRGADQLNLIQQRQINNDAEILRLQQKIESRRDYILSGEATQDARTQAGQIASDTVFTAIINSFNSGVRIVQLLFWAILMIGTELMVINALQETKRSETISLPFKPRIKKQVVRQYLEKSWPEKLPASIQMAQGWPKDQQRELLQILKNLNIIETKEGKIKALKNKHDALEILKNAKGAESSHVDI